MIISSCVFKADACLELCQTFKIEHFVKILNGEKPLTIFVKRFISDIWQGSEYVVL